jgi:hypothetical protein
MTSDIFELVAKGAVEGMGYSCEELEKIGRLYNIDVRGQLEIFFRLIGRSAGALISDSLVQLYRVAWRVRQHLLFQADFSEQMQAGGFYGYLNKPFVFSFISETQYYFLQTSSENFDKVYHFNSNDCSVAVTEWDLVGFLEMLRLESEKESVAGVVVKGDILAI